MDNQLNRIDQFNDRIESLHSQLSDLQNNFVRPWQRGSDNEMDLVQLSRQVEGLRGEIRRTLHDFSLFRENNQSMMIVGAIKNTVKDNLVELEDDANKLSQGIISCRVLQGHGYLSSVQNGFQQRLQKQQQYYNGIKMTSPLETYIQQFIVGRRSNIEPQPTIQLSKMRQVFFARSSPQRTQIDVTPVNIRSEGHQPPHLRLAEALKRIDNVAHNGFSLTMPDQKQMMQRLQQYGDENLDQDLFDENALADLKNIAQKQQANLTLARKEMLVRVGGSRDNFSKQELFDYQKIGALKQDYASVIDDIEQMQSPGNQLGLGA